MKNNILFFLIFLCSCKKTFNSNKIYSKDIELPYYNDHTFTPIWLDQSNKKLAQIHRIKSFNFQNQEGKWINQNDLFGKIYIANFFFTSFLFVRVYLPHIRLFAELVPIILSFEFIKSFIPLRKLSLVFRIFLIRIWFVSYLIECSASILTYVCVLILFHQV